MHADSVLVHDDLRNKLGEMKKLIEEQREMQTKLTTTQQSLDQQIQET